MTNPLAPIQRRQRQDIALLFETLGDAISNAVAHASAPDAAMSAADRLRIMGEVDIALAAIWGHAEGGESAIRDIVLRDTQLARLAPLDAAVKQWRKVLPSDLRARIEMEAGQS